MLITFYCTHCDAKLRMTADAMGSHLICPECDSELLIPTMQLGPGFVVGGFLIKHKLGEGGMGEVYLATQLSLERDVALKILPSRFTRERSFIVRFLKEVHYQAKLDHPNVVAAFDAGEDGGVYFMAMAYVEGQTLEERLEQDGPLDEGAALNVIRQVALALEYASEEKGLLHRDIKPANIMVSTTMQAKVLDMGLSKNTLEKSSSTVADTLLGTPNYMSPEQIDHPNQLDTRSDMFSLGMSLYHMLTGTVPYQDTSYLKTLKRHASEMLEDPRRLMPGISTGTVHFLARLLARDPDDRYSTWEALIQDVDGLLNKVADPDLPQGASSVEVSPELTMDSPTASTPPFDSEIHLDAPVQRTPRGVMLSVLVGMALGALGVLVAARSVNRQAPPPVVAEVPVVIPTPLPRPTPTPVSSGFQSELARVILSYEQDPGNYEDTIASLLELGIRAEDSPVAEEAALQIVRVRRDHDLAVAEEQNRVRQETLKRLYEQGGASARTYLDKLQTPFQEELQPHIRNLNRRISIWEKQEKQQREAEQVAARKSLAARTRKLVPLILRREWESAHSELEAASRDPELFSVTEELGALRQEILDLQAVPGRVLDSLGKLKNQKVTLGLQDRQIVLTIVDVNEDGLLGVREITDDQGNPLGTVELEISFSELSTAEVLRHLEGLGSSAAKITKGLLAHRNGQTTTCLNALDEAGTPLAEAIRQELYPLPTLDSF